MKDFENMFLTQISPQQQLQDATPSTDAQQPVVETLEQQSMRLNRSVVGLAVTELNTTFNTYISEQGNSGRAKIGKLFNRIGAGQDVDATITNSRDQVEIYSRIFAEDLDATVKSLYNNGANPNQAQVNAAIDPKLEALKTPDGFKGYLVQLAKDRKLSDEQLNSIFAGDTVPSAEKMTLENLDPKLLENVGKIYEAKSNEIATILNSKKAMLVGVASVEELADKEASIVADVEAVAKKAKDEFDIRNKASQGGFLDIIIGIIQQFFPQINDVLAQLGLSGEQTQASAQPPQAPDASEKNQPVTMVTPPLIDAQELALAGAGMAGLTLKPLPDQADYLSTPTVGLNPRSKGAIEV